MATSSVDSFSVYEAYLRRFASLQACGRICPTQRALTFQRFLAISETTPPERLDAVLFPSIDQARRCYIASALGYYAGGDIFRAELHAALEVLGMEVLDPWDWTEDSPLPQEKALEAGRSKLRALDSCGRVLAILDGPDVDAAVAAEIGYARALGKRVDGIRTDSRRSRECPALPVSPVVASAIIDSGGRIVAAIEDLADLEWAVPNKRRRQPEVNPTSVAI